MPQNKTPNSVEHGTGSEAPPARKPGLAVGTWLFAYVWLGASVAAQVLVGVRFSAPGQSLAGPIFGVAGVALGLGALGALVHAVRGRVHHGAARSPLGVFALGSGALSFAGLCWADEAPVGALLAGGVAIALSAGVAVSLARKNKRAGARGFGARERRIVVSGLVIVAFTCLLAIVPSGLTLRFRWQDETRLDRLVSATCSKQSCAGSQFDLAGNTGYAYLYAPTPNEAGYGGDACLLHLDGPWWEFGPGGDGLACPVGFTYVLVTAGRSSENSETRTGGL